MFLLVQLGLILTLTRAGVRQFLNFHRGNPCLLQHQPGDIVLPLLLGGHA
jgi:hypothetical protein